MKSKNELYNDQQQEIINRILNILQLDDDDSCIKYKLDNDTEKQRFIIELIPEIKKYFKVSGISGIRYYEKSKRPWISIVRQVIKSKYKLLSCDCTYKDENNNVIRTKKYIFQKNYN